MQKFLSPSLLNEGSQEHYEAGAFKLFTSIWFSFT